MKITTMAIFLSVLSYAQKNYTVNGIIKDKETGELISGAIIKVKEKPELSFETNEYGFYSISLPEGDYTFSFNYKRHQTRDEIIHLHEVTQLNIDLPREENVIEEVKITNFKKRKNIVSTRNKLGAEVLDVESIAKLPVLFGEKDVIKTLQFLPGISSQEGSSGFSVRGGSPDQNLILLDEAPIFNNSHLLGFFSAFNSDALRDVTLYKSNIPSQYGGRLSSIVDVKMKDGNNKNFGVSGGIGLISSRLNIEGPLQKGKSSFIISGRRTYADLFLKLRTTEDGEKVNDRLYFYDFTTKLNYEINDKNKLYLSGYFGKDFISTDNFKNNWGNVASTLRWNSIINSKLFSNTSVIFSNYNYKTINDNQENENSLVINPNIKNWTFKQDFSHYMNVNHSLKYGLQSSYYYFNTRNLPEIISSDFLSKPRSMWENALYINDDYKVTDKFYINYGLRLSALTSGQNALHAESDFKKSYINLEPRVMFNYDFNKSNSVRLSYNRNTQNIQTLNNSIGGIVANDIWLNLRKPEVADQINLGYTKKLNDTYEISAETYFKKMSNLVDFKEGAQASLTSDIENNLLYDGIGRSYGLELLAKKTKGRFTGWFSYTLSKTERKMDGINNGNWYNDRQDKTHNLSLVTNYQLSPRWSLSGAFVYSTGNAITMPVGKYQIDGQTALQYGARNASRMPAYHRLDLNATYESSSSKRFRSSWSFGIYNAYGRKNAYNISFTTDEKDPDKILTVKSVLFTFVPNISYNFKF